MLSALASIAKAVLLQADPYILAVYTDEHGNVDKAIALYRRALELDPRSAYAYSGWGNALYEEGKYSEAIAKYIKAIELDPSYPIPTMAGAPLFLSKTKTTRRSGSSGRLSKSIGHYLDPITIWASCLSPSRSPLKPSRSSKRPSNSIRTMCGHT
jgi:tetratricopeptide (TPR) repeat protein